RGTSHYGYRLMRGLNTNHHGLAKRKRGQSSRAGPAASCKPISVILRSYTCFTSACEGHSSQTGQVCTQWMFFLRKKANKGREPDYLVLIQSLDSHAPNKHNAPSDEPIVLKVLLHQP
ncbi:hypothetical protein GOODEAATRI_003107, partial [Goodea atripinnis]